LKLHHRGVDRRLYRRREIIPSRKRLKIITPKAGWRFYTTEERLGITPPRRDWGLLHRGG
jgi:hypothetical protein